MAGKVNVFKKIGHWFENLKTWQKGVVIGLLVLCIIVVGVLSFVYSKLGMLNRTNLNEDELSCVDVDGYINILLLGVDTRDMDNIEGAGADAIMILSIKEDTGDVRLMSIYRDTYMEMGDEGYYDKITNANRVGGPELMIKSLNQAMDLNISKYVVVNFEVVCDLVDAVGGITVNVEDYEIEQLNKYTIQTAENIGKEDYQLVTEPGEQTLEGVQAVSYGRIRKGVGDDYKRTERMRIVLMQVFEKVKTMKISELNNLINVMIPHVQTNLSNKDIFGLAKRMVDFNIQSSAGWPYNVTSGLLDGVSYVFPDTLYDNVVELHLLMFGREDYVPSDTVSAMSDSIVASLNEKATGKKTFDTRGDSKKTDEKDKEATGSNGTKDEAAVDKNEGSATTPETPVTPEGDQGTTEGEGGGTTTPETPVTPEEPAPETPDSGETGGDTGTTTPDSSGSSGSGN